MSVHSSVARALLAASFLLAGCAHDSKPPEVPVRTTSAAPQMPKSSGDVSVSGDIAKACKIDFGSVDRAPKFDFDESALEPSDQSVLRQVATCVTTGPLKGRSLELVGRADPRGEVEYNFALGEHRADTVERYLTSLGVDKGKLAETSRGKLDATGHDTSSWQRDRRVDVTLQ